MNAYLFIHLAENADDPSTWDARRLRASGGLSARRLDDRIMNASKREP